MKLPNTKILDMDDLNEQPFKAVNKMFNSFFGKHWPQVPLRRWEYVAAIVFSDILNKPGKCLDAGGGVSIFSRFLSRINCDVNVIDIGILPRIENGINYYSMSMTDLKFKEDTFDYVFAISSIEHVNAGRFSIHGMNFDVGDTIAMANLFDVLKPGGTLILTTDFANRYYPPPGLWPTGSHRIYDIASLQNRLLIPHKDHIDKYFKYPSFDALKFDWSNVRNVEPRGFDYTEMILTLLPKNK